MTIEKSGMSSLLIRCDSRFLKLNSNDFVVLFQTNTWDKIISTFSHTVSYLLQVGSTSVGRSNFVLRKFKIQILPPLETRYNSMLEVMCLSQHIRRELACKVLQGCI
jgi:hypothetical protein